MTQLTEYCGYHFRIARKRRGLSQVALARQLHIDQSAVSRLEHGVLPNPSWDLVQRLCVALDMEPHAMMRHGPGPGSHALQQIAQLRGQVAKHVLYLGYRERIPELLACCLRDMQSVRPTVTTLALTLFTWSDGVRQCYATSLNGQIQSDERRVTGTPAIRTLLANWKADTPLQRESREELPIVNDETALAIDQPLPQGMLGIDLREEELADLDAARAWVVSMSEPFREALRLIEDRCEASRHRSELTGISSSLHLIEARLAPTEVAG